MIYYITDIEFNVVTDNYKRAEDAIAQWLATHDIDDMGSYLIHIGFDDNSDITNEVLKDWVLESIT